MRLLNAPAPISDPDEPLADCAAGQRRLRYFALAMQRLPTKAVIKHETGTWNWAILRFGNMTVMAYIGVLITYRVASAMV